MPAILSSSQADSATMMEANITALGEGGLHQPASAADAANLISASHFALSALAGLPLIAGFVTRYQLLHLNILSGIRHYFGSVDSGNRANDAEGTDLEFNSAADKKESSKYQDQVINMEKFNQLKPISKNRNIDGTEDIYSSSSTV